MEKDNKPTKRGGRAKGTPNKITAFTRAVVQSLTSDYYHTWAMAEDIASLTPKERLQTMIELMKFIIPKPSSVDINLNANVTAPGIEDQLRKLAEDC